MAAGRQRARAACLAACALALGLALPVVVSATTGTQTEHLVRVTITDKGTTWKPARRTLHPNTGVTFKITVVNHATQRHWFRIGKRKTKLLRVGKSTSFFYSFTKYGRLGWSVGNGNVRAATDSGTFKVVFPPEFG